MQKESERELPQADKMAALVWLGFLVASILMSRAFALAPCELCHFSSSFASYDRKRAAAVCEMEYNIKTSAVTDFELASQTRH